MKKLKYIIFVFFLFFESFLLKSVSSIITYEQPRGRLGDQLLCYCKAKWISYTYHIPLYYQFFEYSDLLRLSLIEEVYDNEKVRNLKQQRLKGYNGYALDYIYIDCNFKDENTLYIIDQCFYPEKWKSFINSIQKKVIYPYAINYDSTFVERGVINPLPRNDETIMAFKQDKKFIKKLQQLIQPLYELKEIKKPKNLISIAVHVRKGGGFDKPYKSIQEYATTLQSRRYIDFIVKGYSKFHYTKLNILKDFKINTSNEKFIDILQPLKHPPDQFYIDQIKGLSAILRKAPLFVYIFTDDSNPLHILQKFKKAINNPNITFACRETENNHYSNVLDDLFAMSTFDCLIRPYSSLSQMAELLGNHKIVISPRHGIWHEDTLIIDEVLIVIDNKLNILKNFIRFY